MTAEMRARLTAANAPGCKPIPPLGERSAAAISAGHAAVKEIDELLRQLYGLRQQLVSELRQNEDALMALLDAKYGPLDNPQSGDDR